MESDFEYKIIIPGCPRTKKNGATLSFRRYDQRTKRLIPREKPVWVLKESYRDWTKIATQSLMVWKSKNNHLDLPLTCKMNMKCLFYMESKITVRGGGEYGVDLSALYEGIQDVLQGKGYGSTSAMYYQIIMDDNATIIGSHDGSRVLIDNANPRMEITLTPYKL